MCAALIYQTGREFNVCFQGALLDTGNRGCTALTASLVELILKFEPNARIHLLYANKTGGAKRLNISGKDVEVEIVNCRMSHKARLNEHVLYILFLALLQKIIPVKSIRRKIIDSNHWLKTLDRADFLGEIRGGDSFSDIYGIRLFLRGILPCIIAIFMRKDLVMLPQTYGPYRSRISRLVARFILSRSHRILARDKESIALVHELLGTRSKRKTVEFCPDVAFILEPMRPAKPDIQPELDGKENCPLIGLNISSLLYIGGFTHDNMFGLKFEYREFVKVLLRQLMERTDAHVLLVPHVVWSRGEWDEVEVSRTVLESLDGEHGDRIHLVMSKDYDQSEIKGIIGLCDFFAGSRMHACIAAISQGIPTVGLAYSKKFRGVFESADVGGCVVDMREKDAQEVIDATIDAFTQRESLAVRLKRQVSEIKSQVFCTFRQLVEE